MSTREVLYWLKHYRHIQREINDLELRIKELRSKYENPSAIVYSDMPKAHNTEHDLSDYMAKLQEYEETLIARHAACLGLSAQYIQAFEHLDSEQAHVLKRMYMDDKTALEIAKEIPCSERTVYYIRRKAIRKLAELPNVCSPLQ